MTRILEISSIRTCLLYLLCWGCNKVNWTVCLCSTRWASLRLQSCISNSQPQLSCPCCLLPPTLHHLTHKLHTLLHLTKASKWPTCYAETLYLFSYTYASETRYDGIWTCMCVSSLLSCFLILATSGSMGNTIYSGHVVFVDVDVLLARKGMPRTQTHIGPVWQI